MLVNTLRRVRTIARRPAARRNRKRLAAAHRMPASILFYHRVADDVPNDWSMDCATFERQMRWLKNHTHCVDLSTIQEHVRRGGSDRLSHVTFDDGYADNAAFAIPLLSKLGIPCTYFVSTDFVRTGRPFPHDAAAGAPLSPNTIEQLKHFADEGIEIGCHTQSHPDFASIDDVETLRREVTDSKVELESMLDRPIRYFAVPYGLPKQLTPPLVDAIREAGYLGFVSAYGDYNDVGGNPFHLRRFHGDADMSRFEHWMNLDPAKVRRSAAVTTRVHQSRNSGDTDSVQPANESLATPSCDASSDPKRVAFVLTSMPVGGAETLLANLMDRMDKRRFAPEIVCLKGPGPLGQQLSRHYPLHHHLIRNKYDITVLPRLTRLFRARRLHAVVTVGAGDNMFWGRLAARCAGVPKVAAALHSTGWPDGVGRLNRALTSLTDHFIAVADSHGDFLRTHERFPAAKVSVIRNGVDTDRFRPDVDASTSLRRELCVEDDALLVGIVAALRPEKDHRLFVEVARRVVKRWPADDRPLHFVVVGEGPCRQMIEEAVAAAELGQRVHLLGNRDDTHRILAGLDVFALTSQNEASPVSILEALACETPVVAPDVGSIAETVIDGQTGYLAPVGDARSMATAWIRLLKSSALRSQVGSAGRQRVIQNGSLQSMVAGYEALLDNPPVSRSSWWQIAKGHWKSFAAPPLPHRSAHHVATQFTKRVSP